MVKCSKEIFKQSIWKMINKLLEKISRFFINLISINYKLNHKYQNKNQVTNFELILKLLKEKNYNPKYIYDIGCGHGQWTKKSLKFFPNSKYYLFDANNNNLEKLKLLKINNTNIEYKICLLSDDCSTYDFYNMGYGSSIYEEQTSYDRYVEKLNSTTLYNEISSDVKQYSNNLIKLDVQGAEINILKGLKEYINLFEVIILEVSLHNYNKNAPLFDEVMNFMNDNGYKLYDIYDLKRLGKEKSFLLQLDCVFVKKNSYLFNVKF